MIKANFSQFLHFFSNDKIISFSILTSTLLLVASFILAISGLFHLPPEIPIFYSTKTQILGQKKLIFLMPAIIFVIITINLAIIKINFSRMQFLARLIAVATVIVSFLIFWAGFRIISLF